MRQIGRFARSAWTPAILFALIALWPPGPAGAQTTTGTLRGTVKDETGGVLPGVTVEAVHDESGFRSAAATQGSGFFNISLPPGPYTVTAVLPSFGTETRKVRILLGQTQGLEFEMKLGTTAEESITVSASAPTIETKSNEIATNVTEEQIERLPQGNRNFLNFAALSPGVRINDDEQRREVNAAGAEGFNTNVFIDGTSFKNDVLLGGVAGQDASRGNPFPQNAVQEFRVLTQNFKAEYEKASTAIITAITKSGSNTMHGDAFVYYQDKSLVEKDFFAERDDREKPEYERWQGGLSLGGPIVQDSVHYFASWEINDQTRQNRVFFGGAAASAPPALIAQLEPLTGSFDAPFTSNLFFGKISWQPAPTGLLDVTGYYRDESEIRDFGNGQDSLQAASDFSNTVWNAQAKYTLSGSSFLSDTTLAYQDYQWNPHPATDRIGLNYEQVLRIGGRETEQNFDQKRFSIREDFSLLNIRAAGDHVVKAGFVINFNTYDVQKFENGNPIFKFRPDISFDFPYEAVYGSGNPDLSTDNNQYGIYLQDDWTPTSRLTVNAGIRWDYETDMLNNDYVTPVLVREEFQDLLPDKYFTDGNDRPAYKNAFQPRLGASYDVSGKGTTVVFAGYGRYVDRDVYAHILNEKFKLQWATRVFRFSADGLPRDGQPTILWNDSYLSAEGLNGLIAQGTSGKPEVFLLANDTEPPQSDQYSVGVRQALGPVGVEVSYAATRGKNGFTWVRGNRNPDGTCCLPLENFSNAFISDATKRLWYDALFLKVDKPYTSASRWGVTLAYTYAEAEQTGNDDFTFDYVSVAASPRHPTANDERHRIVFSGILGLPWDVRFSTLITLGKGLPYSIFDASRGFGPNEFVLRLNGGEQDGTFPYQSWDFRLQKEFPIAGTVALGIVAEVFNATNHDNFGCFEGFIARLPEVNARFGEPNCTVTQPRRLQFGLTVGF